MVEAHDDIGIHLDEAAIAVPRKARVARCLRQAHDGLVVEPQVEDGVHHPRHRHARARTDRDEQRIGGVAECLAGDPLDMRDARGNILDQPGRILFAVRIISGADVGGDRKARGHRQADRGHFGEVRSLAAQQFLRALGRGGHAAEQMHHLRHHMLLLPRGGGCGWIGMQSPWVDSVLLRASQFASRPFASSPSTALQALRINFDLLVEVEMPLGPAPFRTVSRLRSTRTESRTRRSNPRSSRNRRRHAPPR